MATYPPAPVFPGTAATWRLGETPWLDAWAATAPRHRVIIDNDFAGDPDDLVQLAHHVLSPSVEICLIVSSHLGVAGVEEPQTAAAGVDVARGLFARMGLDADGLLVAGAELPLAAHDAPRHSAATARIVEVALSDDARPLYYVAGGSLTDLASALLARPDIAQRLIVIWIGGFGHDENRAGLPATDEYNLGLDVTAAQVVFDFPGLTLWQVPRTTYGACVISDAEMIVDWAAKGPLGAFLRQEIVDEMARYSGPGRSPAEAYVLGDSPLVLLTALSGYWQAECSSCTYDEIAAPSLDGEGVYLHRTDGRPMRVYTSVDVRLIHADFAAKLALFESWRKGTER